MLPLVTEIRPGGGGTALLRGSHQLVARLLHDRCALEQLADEDDVDAAIERCIVRPALERSLPGAVVEATGGAGDVLVRPLLKLATTAALPDDCSPLRCSQTPSVKKTLDPCTLSAVR